MLKVAQGWILSLPLLGLTLWLGCATPGDPPYDQQRPPADVAKQDQAERERLFGRWSVGYASGLDHAGAREYYTFDEQYLTIDLGRPDTPEGVRLANRPYRWSQIRYRYDIDQSTTPKRLVLKSLPGETPHEFRDLYEFREGVLWICNEEQAPDTASPLHPSRPGGPPNSFLKSLRRVPPTETPPISKTRRNES